jgi:hypothetical protein
VLNGKTQPRYKRGGNGWWVISLEFSNCIQLRERFTNIFAVKYSLQVKIPK